MSTFASEHRYPGFVWLGSRGANWVARDRVPESLLRPHDEVLAALDVDENNMVAAVKWMDAIDSIAESTDAILDRPALEASMDVEMQKLALDALLRHRFSRPTL
jgi:hypothetical protein